MPGPAPLDRPAFPDEFLDECRILVRRRTVPHGQDQRARLVLVLHESPDLSNVAAGALVQLHVTSVHRWRHRWACGDFSLADQAGRGQPAFSPRDRAIVKAIACEAVCQTKLPLSRLSTSDLADQASTALGRSISPSTVWRIPRHGRDQTLAVSVLDLPPRSEVLRKSRANPGLVRWLLGRQTAGPQRLSTSRVFL